jgi:hypothetical protein
VQEKALTIDGRRIGANEPCFIIAEIGLNHNGDLALAKRLVDAAVEAGADAVKFQKRRLTDLYQKAILDQPRNGEQGLQYIVRCSSSSSCRTPTSPSWWPTAACATSPSCARPGTARASTTSRRSGCRRTRSGRRT